MKLSQGADEKSGVLAREQELQELSARIEESSAIIEDLAQQQMDARSRLHELEHGREALQNSVNQATQAQARIESQLTAKQERLEQFHQRKQRLENDLQELHQQRQRDENLVAEARARLDEALALSEDYEQRRVDRMP